MTLFANCAANSDDQLEIFADYIIVLCLYQEFVSCH